MNKNFLFHIFCVCIICTGIISGCNQDEDTLEPSEHLPMKYTLPQGDAEYDDRILDFYKKFDTFILYEYDTIDPFWNVQSVTNALQDYHIVLPKEENVEAGVNIIFDLWLDLYSAEFLQGRLPRYLFLSDSVYYWSTSILKPGVVELKTESYLTTATSMTITGINATLLNMTDSEKNKLKEALNAAYWTFIGDYGKFEAPEGFKNIDYTLIKTAANARAAGMFHGKYNYKVNGKNQSLTPEVDVKESILWLLNQTQSSIDRYLIKGTSSLYPPACKERCILLAEEMKRVDNLELEVLTGKTLPKREKAEE